jgi:hypothetical protein
LIAGASTSKRWALARHFGYAIQVVPAYWIDQEGTHVRLSDYFRTFKEAFEVRWNLLTGVYRRPKKQ